MQVPILVKRPRKAQLQRFFHVILSSTEKTHTAELTVFRTVRIKTFYSEPMAFVDVYLP